MTSAQLSDKYWYVGQTDPQLATGLRNMAVLLEIIIITKFFSACTAGHDRGLIKIIIYIYIYIYI